MQNAKKRGGMKSENEEMKKDDVEEVGLHFVIRSASSLISIIIKYILL